MVGSGETPSRGSRERRLDPTAATATETHRTTGVWPTRVGHTVHHAGGGSRRPAGGRLVERMAPGRTRVLIRVRKANCGDCLPRKTAPHAKARHDASRQPNRDRSEVEQLSWGSLPGQMSSARRHAMKRTTVTTARVRRQLLTASAWSDSTAIRRDDGLRSAIRSSTPMWLSRRRVRGRAAREPDPKSCGS